MSDERKGAFPSSAGTLLRSPAGRVCLPAQQPDTARDGAIDPLLVPGGLEGVPGLEVYEWPQAGKCYVIGADPAEGNPQSDESAATVLEEITCAEVASIAGRMDPSVFAARLSMLSGLYNGAPVLVERNNHGHAVMLGLEEYPLVQRLPGLDGKPGWLTTAKSKALAFDHAADVFRVGGCTIRSVETLRQLQAIEGGSLRAPQGQRDDRAMSFVLALAAIKWGGMGTGLSVVVPAVDPIAEADAGGW